MTVRIAGMMAGQRRDILERGKVFPNPRKYEHDIVFPHPFNVARRTLLLKRR